MQGARKNCENCELLGRVTKATRAYIGFTGEHTLACEHHFQEAQATLAALRDAKAFDGFGGATFDPVQDRERLGKQLCGVLALMVDGAYRTLRQISDATGYPEASISARLRDIRKIYGKRAMEARRLDGGLWSYRCLVRRAAA